MVEMKVVAVALDPTNNTPIIILRDKENKRTLPIWIGIFEASAIALKLEGIATARPLTHDLILSIIKSLNGKVLKVVINALKNNTYFAKIYIKAGRKTYCIDARPSDSIALALRAEASIYVSEEVLTSTIKWEGKESKDFKALLEDINPEDFSKYRM